MSTENLTDTEAIKKLKELSERAGVCMFCTELTSLPNNARPMALQECDSQGNLWFLSSESSNKNFEIREDRRVQLYFINKGDSEFLSIYGNAYIYGDRETIEEQWTPMANAWFDGKDDPMISIIRVAPENAYYWDTKAGKLVTLISLVTSAITGNKTDNSDGVEGNLKV